MCILDSALWTEAYAVIEIEHQLLSFLLILFYQKTTQLTFNPESKVEMH